MNLTASSVRSIYDMLEDNVLEAMRRYVEMKSTPMPDPNTIKTRQGFLNYIESSALLERQRGIVRGCARQLGMYREAYNRANSDITTIEKEFLQRVKGAK